MLTWTYTSEGWVAHEDGITDASRLSGARRKLGFNDSSVLLSCRFGSVSIYSRTPESRCPFEFLCTISVQGEIFRWVWVTDFPCLLKFLREIDAHSPLDMKEAVGNVVLALNGTTYLTEFLQLAAVFLEEVNKKGLEVKVKP